jgi:DNA-binding phage protein
MGHSEKRKVDRTPEETARIKEIRDRFQRERPSLESLVESDDFSPPITQEKNFALMQFAAAFKNIRQLKGMSLSDVSAITGIDKAQLSRIENALNPNPTMATIDAMAHAIGRRVRIDIDEECSVASH